MLNKKELQTLQEAQTPVAQLQYITAYTFSPSSVAIIFIALFAWCGYSYIKGFVSVYGFYLNLNDVSLVSLYFPGVTFILVSLLISTLFILFFTPIVIVVIDSILRRNFVAKFIDVKDVRSRHSFIVHLAGLALVFSLTAGCSSIFSMWYGRHVALTQWQSDLAYLKHPKTQSARYHLKELSYTANNVTHNYYGLIAHEDEKSIMFYGKTKGSKHNALYVIPRAYSPIIKSYLSEDIARFKTLTT